MKEFLISFGAVALLAVTAYFKGHSNGKEGERLKWQTANVQTLLGANENLASYNAEMIARNVSTEETETKAGDAIGKIETRIIERIREVPIETVIKVSDDCRIDYDFIRVRNIWAKGNSDVSDGGNTARADIPKSEFNQVPRQSARTKRE